MAASSAFGTKGHPPRPGTLSGDASTGDMGSNPQPAAPGLLDLHVLLCLYM